MSKHRGTYEWPLHKGHGEWILLTNRQADFPPGSFGQGIRHRGKFDWHRHNELWIEYKYALGCKICLWLERRGWLNQEVEKATHELSGYRCCYPHYQILSAALMVSFSSWRDFLG